MFHGVVENDSTFFSARHIQVEQFEKIIKYIAHEFEIVTLENIFNNVSKKKSGKKQIAVTFDDGYLNNLYTALPILEKYQIPTTFFISGVCLEDKKYILWSEFIAALSYFNKTKEIEIEGELFHNLIRVKDGKELYNIIKQMDYGLRDEYLNKIVKKFNLDSALKSLNDEIYVLMNSNQVAKLAESSIVSIGSHGYFHYNLDQIKIEDAVIELNTSKQIIEKTIGKVIESIAFPDGAYNDLVKEEAKKIGYNYLCAVAYRHESDTSDKLIKQRHGISSTTTYESNILLLNYSFSKKGF